MLLSMYPAVPTQDLTITADDHQFFLTLWIAASSAPCPRCHTTYIRQVDDPLGLCKVRGHKSIVMGLS